MLFRSILCLMISLSAYAAEPASTQDVRTTAASCAACHGSHGNSVGITPTLAGLNAQYFVSQMQSFKAGSANSTVMHHHAKGLTNAEIEALADYFAKQTRSNAISAPKATFAGAQ